MKNATVYLLIAASGEHDEYREHPVAASSSQERLEAHKTELEADDAKHKAIVEELIQHRNAWNLANPRPVLKPSKARPKWPAGMRRADITPEMREARLVVDRENEAINQENSKVFTAHYTKYNEALAAYVKERGFDPERYSEVVFRPQDVTYSIETVPFI